MESKWTEVEIVMQKANDIVQFDFHSKFYLWITAFISYSCNGKRKEKKKNYSLRRVIINKKKKKKKKTKKKWKIVDSYVEYFLVPFACQIYKIR